MNNTEILCKITTFDPAEQVNAVTRLLNCSSNFYLYLIMFEEWNVGLFVQNEYQILHVDEEKALGLVIS